MRATETYKSSATPRSIPQSYLNIPNTLTISRILLIPVFIFLFSNPTPGRSLAAAIVFTTAALTDLLDGYVARRHGQITNLGKLLDPVADKLLVVSGLILLLQFQLVEMWVVIAMVGREIVITGARLVAAREGLVIPAHVIGKLKVVFQILGILFLILHRALSLPFFNLSVIGTIMLYIALVLAWVSGGRYLFEILKKSHPQYL